MDLYLIHFPIPLRFVPFEERYPPEWIFDPKALEPRMEYAQVPVSETWGEYNYEYEGGNCREGWGYWQ